jgi:hypothetical protein
VSFQALRASVREGESDVSYSSIIELPKGGVMIRNLCLAVLSVLTLTNTTFAAAILTQQGVPTVGLPGFTTWTLTAVSTVPDEPIVAIDFAGDGSNDPATGRGFFGAMNQWNPFGLPTIFPMGATGRPLRC